MSSPDSDVGTALALEASDEVECSKSVVVPIRNHHKDNLHERALKVPTLGGDVDDDDYMEDCEDPRPPPQPVGRHQDATPSPNAVSAGQATPSDKEQHRRQQHQQHPIDDSSINNNNTAYNNNGSEEDATPVNTSSAPEANELLAVVQLIASVVHTIVEVIVDFLLAIFLVIPILLPWRVLDVWSTVVPLDRSGDWRREFRLRAAGHVVGACGDILLLPFVALALVIPTRTWPIVESVLHWREIQTSGEDTVSSVCRDIRYRRDLRIHGAAQVVGGFMDIICIIPFFLVLLAPWRGASFLAGARAIFAEVAPIDKAYSPEGFDPANGLSRWMVVLEETRSLLIYHFVGLFFDVPCFLLGLASLLQPTRTMALLQEAWLLRKRPARYVHSIKTEKSMDTFNFRELQILCLLNFAYALLDTLAVPLGTVVVFTIIRAAPLLTSLQRDWANSPTIVKVTLPTRLRGGGRASILREQRSPTQTLSLQPDTSETVSGFTSSLTRMHSTIMHSLTSIEALSSREEESMRTSRKNRTSTGDTDTLEVLRLSSSTTAAHLHTPTEATVEPTTPQASVVQMNTHDSTEARSSALSEEFARSHDITFPDDLTDSGHTTPIAARRRSRVSTGASSIGVLAPLAEDSQVVEDGTRTRTGSADSVHMRSIGFGSLDSLAAVATMESHFASTSMLERTSSLPAEDFTLAEEFNGTYLRYGLYRGGPFYRLLVHNTSQEVGIAHQEVLPAKRPAFLGVWDGNWNLCLTQDPDTVVVRFKSNAEQRNPCAAFFTNQVRRENVLHYTWDVRRNHEQTEHSPSVPDEDEWVEQVCNGSFLSTTARERKLMALSGCTPFGSRKFNMGLRFHVFCNTGWLLLDIFLLPFFLLIMLTAYRFPAIVRKMHRDAESSVAADLGFASQVDTTVLSETWIGDLGFSFGRHSRLEVLRQFGLMLLDILLLPALLLIAATYYRLPALKGKFVYFSLWWHFHILLQLNVICADLFMALPLLLVAVTVYRLRYVRSTTEERWIVSGVDLTVRFEIIRQCCFVFLDLLILPFLCIVVLTAYRRHYLMNVFNPRNLAFHKAVMVSFLLNLHDLALLFLVVLTCTISFPRLFVIVRAMREDLPVWYGRSHDAQWRVREEVYRQVLFGCLDFFTLPAYAITFLTFYRWKFVRPHIATSFCLLEYDVYAEEKGLNLHYQAWWETLVVAHDLVLLAPVCFILLLSYYRAGPALELLRSCGGAPPEEDEAEERDGLGPLTAAAQMQEAREQGSNREMGRSSTASSSNFASSGHDEASSQGNTSSNGQTNTNSNSTPATALEHQQLRRAHQQRQDLRPARWRRITNELIQADPQWGDMVNWNEAPMEVERPSLRRDIWKQFGSLLLDAPFLFLGLFVALFVWRLNTLRRVFVERPRLNERRWATVWQFLLTLRDILVLPIFLLVLLTPRAPKVLAQLCCNQSSKNPLLTDPAMEVSLVEGTLPAKGQPTLRVRGRLWRALPLLKGSSLHVQVVGEAFWQDLAHVRGTAKVGMLRLLLPVRIRETSTDLTQVLANAPVVDESYSVEASDESPPTEEIEFHITLPLTVERRFVALAVEQMRLETWVVIQLEATDYNDKPEVIASVPLRVSDVVAAATSGSAVCSGERLGGAVERMMCLESQHRKGTVEVFAGLVFVELLEFFVDILYFLAFLVSLLAPWRFVELLHWLHAPKERWSSFLSSEALQDMKELKGALLAVRGELLPMVNALAKDPAVVEEWTQHSDKGEFFIPSQVRQYHSENLRLHRSLELSLRAKLAEVSQGIAGRIKVWIEMQDARLYYTTLCSYVNCLLTADRLSIEEHGLIIEAVRSAEGDFERAAERLEEEIGTSVRVSWEEASESTSGTGICSKDMRLIRQITKRTAMQAISDLGAFCSLVGILITVYRVPWVLQDVRAADWPSPTHARFKALVFRHFRLIFVDAWLFLQIIVLWLILLVTMVRFAEVCSELFAMPQTLRSFRDLQWRNLKEAAKDFWALLTMYILVRFAKTLVRSLLQMALVPPACLNELVTRTIGHRVPLVVRFSFCAAIFYLVAALPLLLGTALDAPTLRWVFLLLLVAIALANVLSVSKSKSFTHVGEDSVCLNVTWANAISVLCTISSPATLILLLVGRHSTVWAIDVDCDQATGWSIASIVLTGLWLLVVSWLFLTQSSSKHFNPRSAGAGGGAAAGAAAGAMPAAGLSSSKDISTSTSSTSLADAVGKVREREGAAAGSEGAIHPGILISLQLILSHLLFTPMLVMLSGPHMGVCEEQSDDPDHLTGLQTALLSVFSFYFITTQMLSGTGAVDARYATLFSMVAQLIEVVAVVVPMGHKSRTLEISLLAIAGVASIVWTISYERLIGSAPTPIRDLMALRAGVALCVPWTVVCVLLEEAGLDDYAFTVLFPLGLAFIAVVTGIFVRRVKTRAKERQRTLIEKSGLKEAIGRLLHQPCALCVAQSTRSGWSESQYQTRARELVDGSKSAKAIAYDLVAFQESILADRLNADFLQNRQQWKYKVRKATTFAQVRLYALELAAGIRSPSSLPQMRLFGLRLLRRSDLIPGFLDLLVGHRRLRKLLGSSLITAPSWYFAAERHEKRECLGVVLHRLRQKVATLSRTRLGLLLRRQRAGVEIAGHCLHARVAMEDVLYYFRSSEVPKRTPESHTHHEEGARQRQPHREIEPRPRQRRMRRRDILRHIEEQQAERERQRRMREAERRRKFLTWGFLTGEEGHAFLPSGELLEREPLNLMQAGRPQPDQHLTDAIDTPDPRPRAVPLIVPRHAGSFHRREEL